MNNIHERLNITFYVKLDKSFTETHKIYDYDVDITPIITVVGLVNYVQDQKKLVKVMLTVFFFLTTWE